MFEAEALDSEGVTPKYQEVINEKQSIESFLFADNDIPFICFFKRAFSEGLFKNLGDINNLKANNPTYSSYIDGWLAAAIKRKFVKVLSDGLLEVDKESLKTSESRFILNKNHNGKVYDSCSAAINTMSNIARKDLKSKDREDFSTLYTFYFKDEPSIVKDICEIYSKFLGDVVNLCKKNSSIVTGKDATKVHALGITSCSITQEVFNEI